MKRAVVDTGLALKWEFEEVLTAEARFLGNTWEFYSTTLFVPAWFSCEVANAIFQEYRQGVLKMQEALGKHSQIMKLVEVQDFDPALGARAIGIAFETGQRATYDSHYIALAEHFGCSYWTADERFWRSTHQSYPFVKWLGNVVIADDHR